jgi:hypothetical protein
MECRISAAGAADQISSVAVDAAGRRSDQQRQRLSTGGLGTRFSTV